MNESLISRIMIQLEPTLAQEFIVALAEDEKKIKALEIIKNQDVLPSSVILNKDYDAYMFDRTYQEGWTLTKKKFDFLKEVLGNEPNR